ncbi:MAG TPA: T9SS type A sorting domain-containing protein [Bacteroidia bacterium]|jgi:hypothetical protein|nr:T9SS type A sorting domain-containing protein [Bacteroidia bacterium]
MKIMTRTLLAFAFLFSAVAATAQESASILFFGGDTLKGFDNALAYSNAMTKGLKGMELNNAIHRAQAEFVRSKYPRLSPAPLPVHASPQQINNVCTNLDFETGSYTGWVGAIGYDTNCLVPLVITANGVNTLGTNSAETSCSFHTLVTPSLGNDLYSGMPVVDPGYGGSYGLRLGGENINVNPVTCAANDPSTFTSNGEYIQQTISVTAANALLTYHYMVILAGSTHLAKESPYFRVELRNQTNQLLSQDYFVSSVGTTAPNGYLTSSTPNSGGISVYYCPWTVKSINLTPYIGQAITVRFTAAGCIYGGHFAYAYIDASCGPVSLQEVGGNTCQGQTAYFNAPASGGTYQWKTIPSGTAGIVGATNTQMVTINASGTYEVLVSPSPGTPYTIDTTLTFNPSPALTLSKVDASCGSCGDGTASANVSGGNPAYTYSWYPAVAAGQGTANITSTPGTYTCYINSSNGCTTSGTVTINFATGISAPANNTVFSVSPNPFGNTLKVELGTSIKEATLIVYDLVGKEVLHEQMNAGTVDLNTSGFAPGVYLLSVRSAGGNYLRKIIRQ